MPKFTRHELFCKAFNEFLSNHINIETVNDESIELTSFGPINDYKLINTTSNKSRCKQEYILTVPTQIIICHTDQEEDNDEEALWNDPVPVYGPHRVPTVNQFKKSFVEYFNRYRMYQNGNLMSFKHEDFWQPMDTLRDKVYLQNLWDSGKAPWKTW